MPEKENKMERIIEIAYLGVGDDAAAPAPTCVGVEVTDQTPTIRVGWGDRSIRGPLPVYTDPDASGICVEIRATTRVWHESRGDRYKVRVADRPDWVASVERAAVVIRRAAQMAERRREDVRSSCEDFRVQVARLSVRMHRDRQLFRASSGMARVTTP